jgi:hypothetical protein
MTLNTPDLIAEAGFLYTSDFTADDQPFPVNVASGTLINMPYGYAINSILLRRLAIEGEDYASIIRAQFDQLYEEGSESGTVMCIPLHNDLVAQPHRIKHVRRALEYVLSANHIWQATAADIAESYLEQHLGAT